MTSNKHFTQASLIEHQKQVEAVLAMIKPGLMSMVCQKYTKQMMAEYLTGLKNKMGEGEIPHGLPSLEFSLRKIKEFNTIAPLEDQNKSEVQIEKAKIEDLQEPENEQKK